MKQMYVAIRDGQAPKFMPQFDVKDGYMCGPRGEIMVDSAVPGFAECKTQIIEALTARLYGAIDQKFWARSGLNPSGLRVITQAQWDAERQTQTDAGRLAFQSSADLPAGRN